MEMEEFNVRYGVVNVVEREKYEKKFQISYGYEYTTWNDLSAISYCRRKNNSNFIVEKIFNTKKTTNKKQEVYRSADLKK